MFRGWEVLRTFNRSTQIFLIVWALLAFGYFGIQGVLLNLYLLRLGFGPEFIGILIASGQLIWAIAALPAEAIGRRMGLRAALVMASALTALGIGLVLLVEVLPKSMWTPWLFGCWPLLWIGAALNTVNSPPYLMHVSTVEERNHAFAAQGAVIALMGFVGSVVAGWLPELFISWVGGSLEDPTPYRYALWVAPLSYLLAALIWAGAQPARVVKEVEALSTAPKPIGLFMFFGLVVFLQTASEGAVRAFLNVYLDTDLDVPIAQIGIILGIGQLLSIGGALAVPQLLLRWGTSSTLTWTTLGIGLSMLPLALLPHWLPATIGFIGVMYMTAMNGPTRNVFSQEIVEPQWRTTTSAIITIGLGLGWASTAGVGGYLIARAGFSSLFSASAGLALIAALLLFGYMRALVKRPKTSAAP